MTHLHRRTGWLLVLLAGCGGVVSNPPPTAHAAPAPESTTQGPEISAANALPPKSEPARSVVETPDAPAADSASDAASEDPAVTKKLTEQVGPPLPEFPARAAPYKVLILGDSMAATDFGRQLERRLEKRADIEVARRGKSATGLARPDYFDWMGEAKKRIRRHDPDLVVVIIGGNDGQDLIPKSKKTKPRRVLWHGDDWADAYARRVLDFSLALLADHRRIVWLELPVMEHKSLERKLVKIRGIQKDALGALMPRVAYVPTRPHFVGTQGEVLTKVKVQGYRSAQVLRQDDGIHFTVPGSKYFAAKVAPAVLAALGLEEREAR